LPHWDRRLASPFLPAPETLGGGLLFAKFENLAGGRRPDSADTAIEMANQQAADRRGERSRDQQFNDAMAATQQTENNANFIRQ
jgi:hypothetical protein